MPARHQQTKGRKVQFLLQPYCQKVRMQMVNPKKGFAKTKGQAFGKGSAHQQTAKQPWATRRCHKINIRIGLAAA